MVEENQEVKAGRRALRVGPAQYPDPRRDGRKGPLRRRHRRRDDAGRKGPQRQRPPRDHGAQGRPAPADRARRSKTARSSTSTTCPKRPTSKSTKGTSISAGTLLAKTPREVSGTQDITGGLPRVTEIFEARKPKDPAVIAEIDGTVEIARREDDAASGRSSSAAKRGIEREHLVSHGKHLRVHAGDFVRAGEALVDGPLVPHDILRISGEEAVQQYLVREIQNVYRSQRVEINDKHIEIIVSQMLRKVRVESPGDTEPVAGQRDGQVRVPSGQRRTGQLREDHREGRQRVRGRGRSSPRTRSSRSTPRSRPWAATSPRAPSPSRPPPAPSCWGSPRRSVQSSSFISAASFQETTKVLTEAALAGKVDDLVGLKENVILGHLIPAGTGFRTFQESEVRIQPAGPRGPGRREGTRALERVFPLLDGAAAGRRSADGASREASPPIGADGDRRTRRPVGDAARSQRTAASASLDARSATRRSDRTARSRSANLDRLTPDAAVDRRRPGQSMPTVADRWQPLTLGRCRYDEDSRLLPAAEH